MKIALVLDDSIDRPDGVQQYALTIGRYFIDRGHQVHYVCSESHRTDVTVHSLVRNVRVTFNGNGLKVPLPASRRKIRRLLANERYDVIHVQVPHSPFFAARVVKEARRKFPRTRIVGTFHILPHSRLSAWGTRALGWLLRRNVAIFDAWCSVSAPAATFARSTFGIDGDVIPNAVDVSAFAATTPRPAADGRPLVIAFLGRLVPRKGAETLVRAVSLLPPEVRASVVVRMGGTGPQRDSLRALIEAAGLDSLVTLEGFIAEEDKPQFYADADLAVFPATGGESFGIVLIEAIASGSGVVIGGDNPGYRSVLEDSRVLVDATDPQALADALTRFVSDPSLRESIHRAQQDRLAAYDVMRVGAQVEALYDSVSL